jgi:hypothetical protein
MNARELFNRLTTLDVELTCDGDRLQIDAPRGVLTRELREAIRAQKTELLRLCQGAPPGDVFDAATLLGAREARLLVRFVESVGIRMQRLSNQPEQAYDDWAHWRDELLRDMGTMEQKLRERGETLSSYGWTYTPDGRWHRVVSLASLASDP